MKTEIAVNKIIFKLIERVELKKDPNEAGKQIGEYYDEMVKQFKEHEYDEINKVIVDNFLNMTICVFRPHPDTIPVTSGQHNGSIRTA